MEKWERLWEERIPLSILCHPSSSELPLAFVAAYIEVDVRFGARGIGMLIILVMKEGW